MMRVIAAVRLCAFMCLVPLIVVSHTLVHAATRSLVMARIFHRVCCIIFGLRVRWFGDPLGNGATAIHRSLYVSNHISYLDILVLGAHVPGVFVAKEDVAGWPLFGYLATLQKTVFISRARTALAIARDKVAERLNEGHDIILFPEGTSSDGAGVLPFKAGLFSVLLQDGGESAVEVRPLAIRLLRHNGQPVYNNQISLDAYAWYGDMTLLPHLWHLAQQRTLEIGVCVMPALSPARYADRKALANAAEQSVRDGFASMAQAAGGPA